MEPSIAGEVIRTRSRSQSKSRSVVSGKSLRATARAPRKIVPRQPPAQMASGCRTASTTPNTCSPGEPTLDAGPRCGRRRPATRSERVGGDPGRRSSVCIRHLRIGRGGMEKRPRPHVRRGGTSPRRRGCERVVEGPISGADRPLAARAATMCPGSPTPTRRDAPDHRGGVRGCRTARGVARHERARGRWTDEV